MTGWCSLARIVDDEELGSSHLFILQLRSWSRWSSRPSWPPWPSWPARSSCLSARAATLGPRGPFGGDITSSSSTGIRWSSPDEDFRCAHEAVIYQYPFARPTPTSTLCEADSYQYPLQSQHLPVPIASRPSTSTLWYEMTPSIVRDADFQHSTRCRLQHSTRCRLPT